MKIKFSLRFHLPSIGTVFMKRREDNARCEVVGKEKSPLPAGRSEDWCTHCGNQYGGVSKAGNIGTKDGAEVKKPLILLQRAMGDS